MAALVIEGVPAEPLPDPVGPLVGREQEVAEVVVLLRAAGCRRLTLIGSGGVGKTRVAIRVAAELVPHVAGGVGFVGLSSAPGPAYVLPSIATAIGVHASRDTDVQRGIAAALGARDVLLVLDNLEHVLDAMPAVAALLAGCPGLRVLATSREPLRLSAEQVYPIGPLPLPEPSLDRAGNGLAANPAVDLFVQRARAADPAFPLNAANTGAVLDIVRRLDGLPLAIELAAARVRALPPETLLAKLDPALPLLTRGHRDGPARHRTIREAIAWSYDLLPPNERYVLCSLGVFTGGFPLDAAEAVASAPGALAGNVVDGVAALIDKSLLHRSIGSDGAPRFGMLETVREFALEELAASGLEDEVRGRHADWCRRLAEWGAAAAWAPGGTERLRRLGAERGNVSAALAWSFDSGSTETGEALAIAMADLWYLDGAIREGRGWLERVLARRPPGSSADLRARALHAAGKIALCEQDLSLAGALFSESLALHRQTGNVRGEIEATFYVALSRQVSDARGDAAGAKRLFSRVWELGRAMGHPLAPYALLHLGLVAHKQGDEAHAAAAMQQAHAAFATSGDDAGLAIARHLLALLAHDRGDAQRAFALAVSALRLFRNAGAQPGTLDAAMLAGSAAAALGYADAAGRLLGAVDRRGEELGIVPDPDFRERRGRGLAALEAKVGRSRATTLLAEGRARSFDQAIDDLLAAVACPATDSAEPDRVGIAGLTSREREVLAHIAAGLTNADIARSLSISPRTATTHASHILGKLGLRSRPELIAFAHREGLA